MYSSMCILCTPPCTFYVYSILHLSFVLLCTFPGKVLVDTFVYRRVTNPREPSQLWLPLPPSREDQRCYTYGEQPRKAGKATAKAMS